MSASASPSGGRTKRVLLVGLALLGLVAGAGSVPAGGTAGSARTEVRAGGITAELPPGWHRLLVNVSSCSDPVERLALVAGRSPQPAHRVPAGTVLLLLEEDLSDPGTGFRPRPARFAFRSSPGLLGGCCEMPVGPGDELLFRDHGRDFYGFIILGPRAPKSRASQAAWILNSLRVQAVFRSS